MDKHLHIITLDVPFPVAHGGHTDLFYKLKAFHNEGVRIHLHCFRKKGRKEEQILNNYCASVRYYDRITGITGFSFSLPYIVNSRRNPGLIAELKKDNYPILMEGIHCTSILLNDDFKNRKLLVRLHNIEHTYYNILALYEKNIFRNFYYKMESQLLKKYEKKISDKAIFLAVNEHDALLYKSQFQSEIYYVPVFIPYSDVSSIEGKGTYCLYHGNLSVNENEQAALWLIEVFKGLSIPLTITGRDPSSRLRAAIANTGILLIPDPSDKKMQDLIANAQIHILPSFNNTGIKLKLLNALFNGRHIIVNEKGVAGTNLNELCTIADSADSFRKAITDLYRKGFTIEDIETRKTILLETFDNKKNAEKIMTLIW